MDTMTIGEFKSQFSKVLDQVRQGKNIVISFGRKKEKVAIIGPYSQHKSKKERPLGILAKKAKCILSHDFALSDEDLLLT